MVEEPCEEEGYHRSHWYKIEQTIHKLISYNDLDIILQKKGSWNPFRPQI